MLLAGYQLTPVLSIDNILETQTMIKTSIEKMKQNEQVRKKARAFVSVKYRNNLISSYELHRQANRIWTLEEDIERYSYKWQKDITPHIDDVEVHNTFRPDFIFRRPFVAELKDAAIVGTSAAVLTSSGHIIADSLKRPTKQMQVHAGTYLSKSYLKYNFDKYLLSTKPDFGTVCVLHRNSTSGNFYHWLVDRLLTLRGIARYQKETGIQVSFVVSAHAPSWVYEILEHTGFEDNPVITWNGGPMYAERIVVPSWPELTPQTITWLRDKVVESVGKSNTGPEYVYVSRQKTQKRLVENYDEIQPLLEQYDVQPIYLEDISFEEEVKLMNSSKAIIGPHGAGLTAMIWAKDPSILELFNGITIAPYYIMSGVLGFNYTSMLGKSIDNGERKRDKNTYIDPIKFEKKLDQIIS